MKCPVGRFLLKVRVEDSGCWQWTGRLSRSGYGRIWPGGPRGTTEAEYAHRWAWEHFIGPIPEGLEIDHLCRNRGCVNPTHLEPVTSAENTRRGDNWQRSKTHCKHGHPFVEGSYRIRRSDGGRDCLACERARPPKLKRGL